MGGYGWIRIYFNDLWVDTEKAMGGYGLLLTLDTVGFFVFMTPKLGDRCVGPTFVWVRSTPARLSGGVLSGDRGPLN